MSLQENTVSSDPTVENVRGHLANVVTALSLLDDPRATVENVIAHAVRSVMWAAMNTPNIHATAPEEAERAAAMFQAACPAVAEAMAPVMTPERVYFLMGAVGGLLYPELDQFREDRYDYAGILASELAYVYHNRALAQRGLPLVRAVRIRRALDAPMPEDATLS
jgi:hypothetical protein